jgi:hypothetical protein
LRSAPNSGIAMRPPTATAAAVASRMPGLTPRSRSVSASSSARRVIGEFGHRIWVAFAKRGRNRNKVPGVNRNDRRDAVCFVCARARRVTFTDLEGLPVDEFAYDMEGAALARANRKMFVAASLKFLRRPKLSRGVAQRHVDNLTGIKTRALPQPVSADALPL